MLYAPKPPPPHFSSLEASSCCQRGCCATGTGLSTPRSSRQWFLFSFGWASVVLLALLLRPRSYQREQLPSAAGFTLCFHPHSRPCLCRHLRCLRCMFVVLVALFRKLLCPAGLSSCFTAQLLLPVRTGFSVDGYSWRWESRCTCALEVAHGFGSSQRASGLDARFVPELCSGTASGLPNLRKRTTRASAQLSLYSSSARTLGVGVGSFRFRSNSPARAARRSARNQSVDLLHDVLTFVDEALR